MSSPYSCIVHIGIHKTGSTSIQGFLDQNRARLRELGVHFYSGQHVVSNHVELHAATMRHDRMSTFKKNSGLQFDAGYLQKTTEHVRSFWQPLKGDIALFSAEGLSLLFYKDETDRLAAMLPSRTKIVVYLRDPEDYLRSHRAQLARSGNESMFGAPSRAPDLETDAWLVEYEARLQAFRDTFGPENVSVIDYDIACRKDGNVIPSFLRQIGLENHFDIAAQCNYWLNKS